MLIFMVACTGASSADSSDHWASEKSKCKDKTKGTLAFRQGCRSSLYDAYTNKGDNFKTWCTCVEEKLAFQYLLTDGCELMSNRIVISLSNQDSAKLACGTPKDPR